ncbi:MAG: family 10 glycosylhydrolase, partial [Ignavibacteriaceae bacterium]|nr:family 10 glycosylhydrolase [Ignavibacteriaceae bacterium]
MKITARILILLLLIIATGFSQQQKNSFLWLDAHANFKRLGTEDGVVRILKEAKSAGFKNIILDLRGIDGYVLYPSKIAPVLNERHGVKRASDYNYPDVVMAEAHKLGLGVYFSLNVFSEGDKGNRLGLGYKEHSDWQVQVYTKDGIIPISESDEEIAVFVNPILPAVRNYELSIIEEFVKMYKPDGVVLDRTRYPNISGDFSTASKETFEKFIGEKITSWPYDIYRIESTGGTNVNRVPGKYYKQWLQWRAKVIHDFFADVKEKVKQISPSTAVSDYVGSWYPEYFGVGVNWASNTYHPEKEFEWADSSYYHTGYSQMLDFLFVGNYFYEATK